MASRYWLKCFAVYRTAMIFYASREARDSAVAELVGKGFACAFNN